MNNQEALEYIRTYFDELFGKRNLDALDTFLDKNYFDDDIGDPTVDHIQNGKEFLADLFNKQPTIGVEVKDAISQDNVITAFLDWFIVEQDRRKILYKGVAIFVLNDRKILKRHTYIYHEE